MTEQHVTELHIPELALVALLGAPGAATATFAARVFSTSEVLTHDHDAVDGLLDSAGERLAAGKLTVVDATAMTAAHRDGLLAVAKAHDVQLVAMVVDPSADQDTAHAEACAAFRVVHHLQGTAAVDNTVIVRDKLATNFRDHHGPFDIIGDIHGCRTELEGLLDALGYTVLRDDAGRAVDARHPDGRTVVFVGDFVDRGPDSPGVLRLAMGMHAAGNALAVSGNHEAKLVRALDGKKPRLTHGLAETMEQLATQDDGFVAEAHAWCRGLVSHMVLDDGDLVVAHAGLKESYHGRTSGRERSFALYGDTTGATDEYGFPVRYPWANDYTGDAAVVYGHTPTTVAEWINNTLCLDTGCVFGGELTALRYPERDIVSVPAGQVWHAPKKPLTPLTDNG